MGLYGGLRARDTHQRKELNGGQQILDHTGSTELGGAMPEDLPTLPQSIQELQDEQLRQLRRSDQLPLFGAEEPPAM